MTRFLIIFTMFLLFACMACKSSHTAERIQTIDSLLAENENLTLQFHAINRDSVKKVFASVKSATDLFQQKLMDLPKNEKVRQDLNRHGAIFKGIRRFMKDDGRIDTDLSYSKSQLQSLKADVTNELLTDEQYSKYIKDERTELNLLSEDIKSQVLKINDELSAFESVRGNIEYLVDSLKKPGNKHK
jgi:hypothetical protein